MPNFTTNFSVPGALSGLAAAPDEMRSAVVLTWTASGMTAAEFYRYRVFRRPSGGEFALIGEVVSQTDPTFTDVEAPHGTSEYAVTISNGWAEGDPDTVAAALGLDYWIVSPADPSLVFAVPHVSGYEETFDSQRETFKPIGRSAPIAVDGETLPAAGTVSLKLLAGEGAVFDLIRRAAEVVPWVDLKSPFGDVHRVRIGNVRKSRGGAGTQDVSFEYLTVAV